MKAFALLAIAALPLGAGASGQAVESIPQVNEQVPLRATEAAPQISAPRDKALSEDQLSTVHTARQPVTQVTSSGRSAQGPQSLSERSAGRPTAVERIAGRDRCDPALPKEKRAKSCNDVIEARAADFELRNPTELSPEQRLLLTREIQGAGHDVANATQRLGKDAETDDPFELGIAATVLNHDAASAKKDDESKGPKIDAATQAVINAIIVNQTTPH